AREFYGINEQQVFDKALGLYRQAMKLAPQNLVLAVDYAESYYGIKPLRTNDALVAWTNCLNIAKDDNEREGVLLHLARVKISAGFYDEAQAHLDAVTNAAFLDLKNRLARSLIDHKNPPTNSVGKISANSVVASTNLAAAVTNVVTATNGVTLLSSNLLTMPPPMREPKP
ncbi:MAG TPA: hypothetical protein DCQ92_15105, partial [Verrucomicrobia subdivision 3 bacterium]|nr:hypothetical protein [Limisphaerales bacterium]